MSNVIGECGKHKGQNMVNCPVCASEKTKDLTNLLIKPTNKQKKEIDNFIKKQNTKKNNIMAHIKTKPSKRKKTETTALGTKGKGKSYSRTYLEKNGFSKDEVIVDNISNKIEKAVKKAVKKRNKYNVDLTKINMFLRTLNSTELGYVYYVTATAESINSLIKKHSLTREQFCNAMGIKKSQYNNYTRGMRNYDLIDMAKFGDLKENLSKKDKTKEK